MRLQVGDTKEIGDALFASAIDAVGAMYRGLSPEQRAANASVLNILTAALMVRNGLRIPKTPANDPR